MTNRRYSPVLTGRVCSMNPFLIAALAPSACNVSGADVKRGNAPCIEVNEEKISEWPVPTPLAARDPAHNRDNIYFSVAKGDKIARFDSKSNLQEWKLPAGTATTWRGGGIGWQRVFRRGR